MAKRGVKTASITLRIPSAVKRAAKRMAKGDGFTLSSWIDSQIRKEAEKTGMSVRPQQRAPKPKTVENRPSL